jgi:hypothetical protein
VRLTTGYRPQAGLFIPFVTTVTGGKSVPCGPRPITGTGMSGSHWYGRPGCPVILKDQLRLSGIALRGVGVTQG